MFIWCDFVNTDPLNSLNDKLLYIRVQTSTFTRISTLQFTEVMFREKLL